MSDDNRRMPFPPFAFLFFGTAIATILHHCYRIEQRTIENPVESNETASEGEEEKHKYKPKRKQVDPKSVKKYKGATKLEVEERKEGDGGKCEGSLLDDEEDTESNDDEHEPDSSILSLTNEKKNGKNGDKSEESDDLLPFSAKHRNGSSSSLMKNALKNNYENNNQSSPVEESQETVALPLSLQSLSKNELEYDPSNDSEAVTPQVFQQPRQPHHHHRSSSSSSSPPPGKRISSASSLLLREENEEIDEEQNNNKNNKNNEKNNNSHLSLQDLDQSVVSVVSSFSAEDDPGMNFSQELQEFSQLYQHQQQEQQEQRKSLTIPHLTSFPTAFFSSSVAELLPESAEPSPMNINNNNNNSNSNSSSMNIKKKTRNNNPHNTQNSNNNSKTNSLRRPLSLLTKESNYSINTFFSPEDEAKMIPIDTSPEITPMNQNNNHNINLHSISVDNYNLDDNNNNNNNEIVQNNNNNDNNDHHLADNHQNTSFDDHNNSNRAPSPSMSSINSSACSSAIIYKSGSANRVARSSSGHSFLSNSSSYSVSALPWNYGSTGNNNNTKGNSRLQQDYHNNSVNSDLRSVSSVASASGRSLRSVSSASSISSEKLRKQLERRKLIEKISFHYIKQLDDYIRQRRDFYAPGYYYNVFKLFKGIHPPKQLKLHTIKDFRRFLKYHSHYFRLSSNQKSVELMFLTQPIPDFDKIRADEERELEIDDLGNSRSFSASFDEKEKDNHSYSSNNNSSKTGTKNSLKEEKEKSVPVRSSSQLTETKTNNKNNNNNSNPTAWFGSYHCVSHYCDKKWNSVHSFPNTYQLCPRCHTRVFPFELRPLQEEDKDYNDSDEDEDELEDDDNEGGGGQGNQRRKSVKRLSILQKKRESDAAQQQQQKQQEQDQNEQLREGGEGGGLLFDDSAYPPEGLDSSIIKSVSSADQFFDYPHDLELFNESNGNVMNDDDDDDGSDKLIFSP
jgi:hypothetical protein